MLLKILVTCTLAGGQVFTPPEGWVVQSVVAEHRCYPRGDSVGTGPLYDPDCESHPPRIVLQKELPAGESTMIPSECREPEIKVVVGRLTPTIDCGVARPDCPTGCGCPPKHDAPIPDAPWENGSYNDSGIVEPRLRAHNRGPDDGKITIMPGDSDGHHDSPTH